MMHQKEYTLLPRSFYARDTVIVARELIGHILVRTIGDAHLAGIITETEAYRSDDPACHAFRGKTDRTAPLFGTVGTAYVYISYGMHHCFNIVARSPHQIAGGVLIRAIIPIIGNDHMKTMRSMVNEKLLTNGPGKLTQALSITKQHNFLDCTQEGEMYVIQGSSSYHVDATPRIGISQAQDALWRFIMRAKI